MRNENPNYHFGNRITYLMETIGINTKTTSPSPDRILTEVLYNSEILKHKTDYQEEEKKELWNKEIQNTKRVISDHRKVDSATKISGAWIDRYCKLFHCDSDYLFGYTDTPSKKTTDISDATGLTKKSVDVLRFLHEADRQVEKETLEILNYVFETQYKTIPEGFSPPDNGETLLYQIRKYVSLKIADKKDYDNPVLIPAGLIGNEEIHTTVGDLIDNEKQSLYNKITYQIQKWSNTQSFIKWKEEKQKWQVLERGGTIIK